MSRSCTQASQSAWWSTELIGTWPGGASASIVHASASSASNCRTSVSVDSTNRSRTSANERSPDWATDVAGDATGSNVERYIVGSPRSPAAIDSVQKKLVLSRCTMTSRADHPSHRLGWAHCSSVNSATAAASRRRWRIVGATIANGSPSSTMIGSAP